MGMVFLSVTCEEAPPGVVIPRLTRPDDTPGEIGPRVHANPVAALGGRVAGTHRRDALEAARLAG